MNLAPFWLPMSLPRAEITTKKMIHLGGDNKYPGGRICRLKKKTKQKTVGDRKRIGHISTVGRWLSYKHEQLKSISSSKCSGFETHVQNWTSDSFWSEKDKMVSSCGDRSPVYRCDWSDVAWMSQLQITLPKNHMGAMEQRWLSSTQEGQLENKM